MHLNGDLKLVPKRAGLIIFVHGSGGSRLNPRNRRLAELLNAIGMCTLLVDLLTGEEDAIDALTAELRFDIPMLAQRAVAIIDWTATQDAIADLPIGLLGAGTGAAVAIVAAVERPKRVRAIVSRAGRVDLAGAALSHLHAPLLELSREQSEKLDEAARLAGEWFVKNL